MHVIIFLYYKAESAKSCDFSGASRGMVLQILCGAAKCRPAAVTAAEIFLGSSNGQKMSDIRVFSDRMFRGRKNGRILWFGPMKKKKEGFGVWDF